MVSVEWLNRPRQLSVAPGERLLDALDERPQMGVSFGCRSGHCGTCRVRVVEGAELMAVAEAHESETLLQLGAGAGERLACQMRINADAGRIRLAEVT